MLMDVRNRPSAFILQHSFIYDAHAGRFLHDFWLLKFQCSRIVSCKPHMPGGAGILPCAPRRRVPGHRFRDLYTDLRTAGCAKLPADHGDSQNGSAIIPASHDVHG